MTTTPANRPAPTLATETATPKVGTPTATPEQRGSAPAHWSHRLVRLVRAYPLPALSLLLLLLSLALWLTGEPIAADWPMIAVIIIGGAPLAWKTLNEILRGHLGVDLIAIVAITGSLLLGQYLAGSLVVLMLSGGEALEAYALKRAQTSLSALAERTPRWAHLRRDGQLETVSADVIQTGMEIVIKPGELAPVDGTVTHGVSNVSEADLTGEPLPVRKEPGAEVLSGSVNLDGVLDVRAARPASESHYYQIVRLVEEARKSKAPIHRLADRFAVWFTVFSLTVAALAWALTGDRVYALAVLVVATPCPLILATPIAIMSGMNRATRLGLIVKSGATMELLGEVDVAIFDKTGTLTVGRPRLVDTLLVDPTSNTVGPPERHGLDDQAAGHILQLAASIEQFSSHVLARSVVEAAASRGVPLLEATDIEEVAGKGVRGSLALDPNAGLDLALGDASDVSARRGPRLTTVAVGNRTFLGYLNISIPATTLEERARLAADGKIASFVTAGGRVIGLLVFADVPRAEAARLTPELRRAGIQRTILLTGDGEHVARQVGQLAGMDRVIAQCLPEDKVRVVADEQAQGHHVLMVGDGVNDAPALALATVGVAVGGESLNATAAVADAVLLSPDITQIAAAVRLGRHVMRIAKQGIWLGMALSVVAMALAAAGFILPAAGAILQEGIDLLVIFNALRAGYLPASPAEKRDPALALAGK